MHRRVVIASVQPETRSALRLLLEQEGFEVAGEAAEAQELLASAGSDRPEVLVLDWGLPGLRGDELVATVRGLLPNLEVIALGGRPEARRDAMSAGADAYVSKGDSPESLLNALAPAPGRMGTSARNRA